MIDHLRSIRLQGSARTMVFVGCVALLGGCTLEPVGEVLVGASNLGQQPAQINSFTVDPQQVDIGLSCGTSSVGAPSAVTKVRWTVVGKRIRLALDGNTVHQQSTPEIRETITGEFEVELDASSLGVIRLVAYNAVDERVMQDITVNIRVSAPTSCEP